MTFEEVRILAYRRLAIRGYHSTELRHYLEKKLAEHSDIDKVFSELQKLGYLNDEEWVIGAIRSLISRKYGPRAIMFKLMSRGIPEEEITPHLNELKGHQAQVIQKIIETKYRTCNLMDFKTKQKVMAALVRKGFDLNEVVLVITNIHSNSFN